MTLIDGGPAGVTVPNEVLVPPEQAANMPLDDMATQWCAYIRSGAASDEALAAFRVWLGEKPAHAEAYRRVEQAWSDVDFAAIKALLDVEEEASVSAALPYQADRVVRIQVATRSGESDRPKTASISPFQPRKRPLWSRLIPAGAMAASLLVVSGAGIWALLRDPVTEFHYETAMGEIRSISLDDGSTITLGGASSISGGYSTRRRDVSLASGRIYVDVASNPKRPFVVAVAKTRVQVVGTAFDIELRPDGIRVAVERGIVRVAPADSEDEGKSLRAGEDVRATLSGQMGEVGAFDPASLHWRTGRLEYIDVPLGAVVAEVNRYRAQKIRLADAALGNLRVSLSVPAGETDLLLSGLEATLPVRVTRSATDIVISGASLSQPHQ